MNETVLEESMTLDQKRVELQNKVSSFYQSLEGSADDILDDIEETLEQAEKVNRLVNEQDDVLSRAVSGQLTGQITEVLRRVHRLEQEFKRLKTKSEQAERMPARSALGDIVEEMSDALEPFEDMDLGDFNG